MLLRRILRALRRDYVSVLTLCITRQSITVEWQSANFLPDCLVTMSHQTGILGEKSRGLLLIWRYISGHDLIFMFSRFSSVANVELQRFFGECKSGHYRAAKVSIMQGKKIIPWNLKCECLRWFIVFPKCRTASLG